MSEWQKPVTKAQFFYDFYADSVKILNGTLFIPGV